MSDQIKYSRRKKKDGSDDMNLLIMRQNARMHENQVVKKCSRLLSSSFLSDNPTCPQSIITAHIWWKNTIPVTKQLHYYYGLLHFCTFRKLDEVIEGASTNRSYHLIWCSKVYNCAEWTIYSCEYIPYTHFSST